MARLTVVRNIAVVGATAAERLTSLIEESTHTGTRSISLAGGKTPRQLYDCLADPTQPWRARIEWARIELFWGDERAVPPDHPDSNFGLAHNAFIQHVPIPTANVHRMRGELAAIEAAREYDAVLRERARTSETLFDVMLLGIGVDSHIASIFPESPLLTRIEQHRDSIADPARFAEGLCGELASAVFVPALSRWRVTLTPAALLDARAIIVLATGGEKAEAVATAIRGEMDIQRHPAQLLRAAGERVAWIMDEAAATLLR